MIDLTYFNIGYRADSSARALEKLKDYNIYHRHFIEDAYELITMCRESLERDYSINNYKSLDMDACKKAFTENILDFAEKPQSEGAGKFIGKKAIISRIESMLGGLLQNQKSSDEELESGILFFENLSEICLRMSSPVPSCW